MHLFLQIEKVWKSAPFPSKSLGKVHKLITLSKHTTANEMTQFYDVIEYLETVHHPILDTLIREHFVHVLDVRLNVTLALAASVCSLHPTVACGILSSEERLQGAEYALQEVFCIVHWHLPLQIFSGGSQPIPS